MRATALVLVALTIASTVPLALLGDLAPGAQGPVGSASATPAPGAARIAPVAFEPNLGQTDPAATAVAHARGYALALGPGGAAFALPRSDPDGGATTLRMTFPGAAMVAPRLLEPTAGVSNYYVGGDAARWVEGAPRYAHARYEGLWPGIALDFHEGPAGSVEYDFVVAPGADPGAIRLAFEGAGGVAVTPAGDLALAAPFGGLLHRAPALYQERDGQREAVQGRYVLRGPAGVGFEVGPYDAARSLVIDPVLLYSELLGGTYNASAPAPPYYPNGYEEARGIAVDGFGAAYVMGETTSLDFPLLNATQVVRGGFSDIFVAKFDPFGTLVYSTYLGGSQNNTPDAGFVYSAGVAGFHPGGIAADALGEAYVASSTSSNDFPLKNPLYDHRLGGWDAVVAKLDARGQLAASTYLGGSSTDFVAGMGLDAAGSVYVGGETASTDLPATAGSAQAALAGSYDGFVIKLTPALDAVMWSTYDGGTSTEYVTGMAVDPAGEAVLAGYTYSTNIPRTNAYQPTPRSGTESFVSKLAADGRSFVFSTYLGGYSDDYATGAAIDATGNVYVSGFTDSTTLDIRGNAFQPVNAGGTYDGFLAKYSPTGTLTYSTYLGGAFLDEASSVAADGKERAYVTGYTQSSNFPLTPDAYNATFTGTNTFIMQVDTKASSAAAGLVWSTFFGGATSSTGRVITADTPGNIYLAGIEYGGGFPLVHNTVANPAGSKYYDAWAAAFIQSCGAPPVTIAGAAGPAGNASWFRGNTTVTLTPTSASCPVPYTAYSLDGGPVQSGRIIPVSGDGVHTLVFHSVDLLGGVEANRTFTVRIDATPPVTTTAVSGLAGVGCWYRSEVNVTFKVADATSGVPSGPTWYSLDGGAWTHASTLHVAGDAVHQLRYYSVDVAGNPESPKETDICLDHIPPTVNLTRPAAGDLYVLDIQDPLRPALPVTAVVGTLTVTVRADDDFSGVERVELWVDGALRETSHDAPFTMTWKSGDEALGQHTVKAVAYDRAGNPASDARTVLTLPTRPDGLNATLYGLTGIGLPIAAMPDPAPPLPDAPALVDARREA